MCEFNVFFSLNLQKRVSKDTPVVSEPSSGTISR